MKLSLCQMIVIVGILNGSSGYWKPSAKRFFIKAAALSTVPTVNDPFRRLLYFVIFIADTLNNVFKDIS